MPSWFTLVVGVETAVFVLVVGGCFLSGIYEGLMSDVRKKDDWKHSTLVVVKRVVPPYDTRVVTLNELRDMQEDEEW